MNNTEYNQLKLQTPLAKMGCHGVFAGLAGKYFVSRLKEDRRPMIPQSGKLTREEAIDLMISRAGAGSTVADMCDAVFAGCNALIEAGAEPTAAIERASEMERAGAGVTADDWPSTIIFQRLYSRFGLRFTPLSDEEWSEITQQQIIN